MSPSLSKIQTEAAFIHGVHRPLSWDEGASVLVPSECPIGGFYHFRTFAGHFVTVQHWSTAASSLKGANWDEADVRKHDTERQVADDPGARKAEEIDAVPRYGSGQAAPGG